MTNLVLSPVTVDGIEFYVTNDGSRTGMSMSGLSRLCGVDRSTVVELLGILDASSAVTLGGGGSQRLKSLEAILGNVFEPGVTGVNNAKIVNSSACAQIITYYAYESPAANEVAKHSLKKFVSIGIDTWIKTVTGFNGQTDDTKVIAMLTELITEVKDLRQVTVEYKQLKGATASYYPNLDIMLDELAQSKHQDVDEESGITLAQWLLIYKQGITLDKSSFHRFAGLVSDTYKSTVGKNPEKRTIKKAPGRYVPNTTVYRPSDYPIIEMCWRKMITD